VYHERSTLIKAIYHTYFVVNGFIQVFYEDIALSGLTKGRVTLRPHDPAEIIRDKVGMIREEVT
jgi:hypothetical protein